jgi:hypothetical protein
MQEASGDALLTGVSAEQIAALASLYDTFAHPLDPFAPEVDRAERVFTEDVANLYDRFELPKPSFHLFRRAVILRCKKHLNAMDKPSDKSSSFFKRETPQ